MVERGERSDGSSGFEIVDVEPSGPSPGDLIVENKEIYDKDSQKLLGAMTGWCLRTVPFKEFDCVFTFKFSEGTIIAQGTYYDKTPDSLFAVTGGTGKYVGARGEMKSVERGAASTDYDNIFILSY
ncbi:MAG: allene oxide cyclase family protein [Aestuariivirga sp.]